MVLTLRSTCVAGSKFTGRTKYSFWSSIEEGDILAVTLKLEPSGRSSKGMYAPTVNIENMTKGGNIKESFNLVQQYLSKINIKISSI